MGLPLRRHLGGRTGDGGVGEIRRAVITAGHKYVYDPADEPELYDLRVDPLETANLARVRSSAEIMRALHEEGKRWASAHGDFVSWG